MKRLASTQRVYLVVLKLQAVEVAERTSKEVGARQFGMCIIHDDELNVEVSFI